MKFTCELSFQERMQVSRINFKLMSLFRKFSISLSRPRPAIDVSDQSRCYRNFSGILNEGQFHIWSNFIFYLMIFFGVVKSSQLVVCQLWKLLEEREIPYYEEISGPMKASQQTKEKTWKTSELGKCHDRYKFLEWVILLDYRKFLDWVNFLDDEKPLE